MSEQINSVDFWVEELTHDTNPEHFNHHENFISYMHDEKISSFGNWMLNNGYNAGLVNLQIKVNTYCAPQEHETTTLEPVTQGVDKYFKCSYCGMIVNPHGCARVLDYNYCPYCSRPVAGSKE